MKMLCFLIINLSLNTSLNKICDWFDARLVLKLLCPNSFMEPTDVLQCTSQAVHVYVIYSNQ